jgi:hypothetical protein
MHGARHVPHIVVKDLLRAGAEGLTVRIVHGHLLLSGDFWHVERGDLVDGGVDLEEHLFGFEDLLLNLSPLGKETAHLELVRRVDKLVL